jgi:hypothetical protein
MRARDFVKSNVAYHEELNPVAWTNGRLRPEVRRHLAKVARVFEQYLEIPGFKVHDVVLTGSMANYNYTKYSDFDLHIITDYTDLECDDLAEAFYRAKKQIWNDAHDITIRGHEIECYIEDIAQPPVSGGVYSILQDTWIKQPSYDPPRINNTAVNLKTRDLVKQINSVIKERDVGAMEQLKDKLRRMRRSGLDTEGEFGVENLSFKILRNMGYIDRLHRATVDQQDVELSLTEISEVTMVPTVAKSKREHLDVMPNDGRPIPAGQEAEYLGDLVAEMDGGYQLWSWRDRGTVTYYVFDTETRTSQLGTTGRPYKSNPDSFVVQGVYSGPRNRYRAADLYAFLIINRGLTLVSDNKQSEGGYRVWQELQRRYGNKINIHGFDTRTDEPVNVSADPDDEPDTHVDRDTVKQAGPQMKRELGSISRDLRFVASAR